MRVRFSPDIFRIERRGGVSRYVTELHGALLASGVDSRILAGLHRSAHLRGLDGSLGISIEGIRPTLVRQGLSKVVDRSLERVWAPRQDRSTVYHKTYFDHSVPSGPTLAVTVYDMIHERYPEVAGPRDVTILAKRRWCEAAAVVFAISNQTRDDLIEHYRLDPERVVVTHLGVATVEPDNAPLPVGSGPFVLYVGNRSRAYKNWNMLLEAMVLLDREITLLCFGPPPTAGELARVASLGLAGRVSFTEGDDAHLASAYRRAAALAYPSRYEGFGLPPLEAMINGCPVVAGRAGALPEVLGEAARFVDPDDVEDLTDALASLAGGGVLADRLRDAGRARAGLYSWEATAAATRAGYLAALA